MLVALADPASAQNKTKKITYGDTIKHRFIPTGVRVGIDAIAAVKSRVTTNWTGWEVNADIDFWRYFLAVEVGNWSRNEMLTNGRYTNTGTYYRVGADVNFMMKERQKNMFFLGFRYGVSNFDETVAFNYQDPTNVIGYRGTYQITTGHTGLSAHWFELTTGLRARIWGPFWTGYTARLKFAPSYSTGSNFHAFDIPGYGIAEKATTWGINYQLMFRIPLPKIR